MTRSTRRRVTVKQEGVRAAEILVSISPKLSPMGPTGTFPARFDPLESLADLASMELQPPMSRSMQALSLAAPQPAPMTTMPSPALGPQAAPHAPLPPRPPLPLPLADTAAGASASASPPPPGTPAVLSPQLQSIYNQDGRVGIYTRKERQRIIARYLEKRQRRVWRKKIRYGCRKNLADKRVRVKGRFVKLAPEAPASAPQAGQGVFAGWVPPPAPVVGGAVGVGVPVAMPPVPAPVAVPDVPMAPVAAPAAGGAPVPVAAAGAGPSGRPTRRNKRERSMTM